MSDYPKTLHKKDGIYSTKLNGKRVSFSVVKAVDAADEDQLTKNGWSTSIKDAFKTKRKPKEKTEPLEEKTETDN